MQNRRHIATSGWGPVEIVRLCSVTPILLQPHNGVNILVNIIWHYHFTLIHHPEWHRLHWLARPIYIDIGIGKNRLTICPLTLSFYDQNRPGESETAAALNSPVSSGIGRRIFMELPGGEIISWPMRVSAASPVHRRLPRWWPAETDLEKA